MNFTKTFKISERFVIEFEAELNRANIGFAFVPILKPEQYKGQKGFKIISAAHILIFSYCFEFRFNMGAK